MANTARPYITAPDGPFPNNPSLPLLIYPQAVALTGTDPAAIFEALFREHQWQGAWRNGVFDFHHYHSSAHEVLGVYRGTARLRFGGPQGITAETRAGDVVIIPAGVAHQRIASSPDFAVVGAYPRGQTPDMCYGRPGERPGTDNKVQATPPPAADPVHGPRGGLKTLWQA